MTLQEYMDENFTVIDATSQGMSLQEAIEEVKAVAQDEGDYEDYKFEDYFMDDPATAIATILNAVVKGELK